MLTVTIARRHGVSPAIARRLVIQTVCMLCAHCVHLIAVCTTVLWFMEYSETQS